MASGHVGLKQDLRGGWYRELGLGHTQTSTDKSWEGLTITPDPVEGTVQIQEGWCWAGHQPLSLGSLERTQSCRTVKKQVTTFVSHDPEFI